MSLINAIVDKSDQVKEIELLNPYENDVDKKEAKISILDIKAKGKDGTYYNIEVQVANEIFYMEKSSMLMLWYAQTSVGKRTSIQQDKQSNRNTYFRFSSNQK